MFVWLCMRKHAQCYVLLLCIFQEGIYSRTGSASALCLSHCKAATAAAASSFLQAEAWSPACINRAREQRKNLLSRFFSWKAPNKKIFKSWAAVLLQGNQLPGVRSVWSKSLLVSEVGGDITPHSPAKRPHGAPQLCLSVPHELWEALMPIPCHWSHRFQQARQNPCWGRRTRLSQARFPQGLSSKQLRSVLFLGWNEEPYTRVPGLF